MISPRDPDFWNPEVFAEESGVQIRPKKGGLVPFRLWSHQRILASALMAAYAERKWLAHVKPRQEGSSTLFSMVAYQHAGFRSGCQSAIVAHTEEQAVELNAIALRFWKSTDPALRPYRDPQLKRWLEFPDIDSKLTVASVQDDEPLRGKTAQFVLATEVSSPQWAQKQDAWAAILNAVPDPSEGGMIVAESTPRHFGDQLHHLLQESEDPSSPWMSVFIPWTMVSAYQAAEVPPKWNPRPDVLDYANRHALTPAQAFYMQSILLPKCKNRWEKFRAEYPITVEDAFSMAGDPIFDAPALHDALRALDGGTGVLSTSVEEEWISDRDEVDHKDRFVISIDPASSFARRDFFGAVVGNMTKARVSCTYLGHTRASTIAAWALKEAKRLNNAVIIVEANGVGEAVLSHLLESGYPEVFCRSASDTTRVPGHGEMVPGFWSSAGAKASAISKLQDAVEERSWTIASVRLLRQLLNYRGGWEKRARDDSGGHFDLVAAFAMAVWFWSQEAAGGRLRVEQEDAGDAARAAFRGFLDRIGRLGGKEQWNSRWGSHR